MDAEGQKTGIFGSLVFATSSQNAHPEPIEVAADAVACVIDISESIDLGHLREAYQRIAQAKTLKKTPAPETEDTPVSSITLGIVFALHSTVPLEKLAEELDRLNRETPSSQWPDMLVVLSTGTINYVVQFPGEHVSADFLPPGEGALTSYTPPMYVILFVRATGAYTFNKMFAYLTAHLAFFSPGWRLTNWAKLLEGSPKEGIVVCGYQYNLSGELLPVPRQFYNDRYLPPPPLRIEDGKGTLLSTLQFLPWQDGGVILLRGKLPLEGLLVFLGKKALERGGIIRRPDAPDAQISYVLPITQADFMEMVKRLQRQSNLVVRKDSTKWVLQKFADEGSTSPFMARLFMGIVRFRDAVFPHGAKRDEFDKAYDFFIMTLMNARTTAQEIGQLLVEHARKVSQGEIAKTQGQAIQIDQSIDRQLRRDVETFLNSAVRALKQGMQDVTKIVHVNIGFFFQKPDSFANGVAALEKTDPHLAAYLREARKWSERLLDIRNAVEHKGWTLPRIRYSQDSGGIRSEEPQISGQPVSTFVEFTLDRLCCFGEEVTSHCLQSCLSAGISITEIPPSQRKPEIPERFQFTLATGGMPVWTITYHQSKFEET